ncbi:MAG: SDR family oxidoreductase [Acidimicrobiia bacterium]|nr:SDR family oxidoreductase [Acidimicrobiia bacterium]
MKGLRGRRIVITGGAGDIGSAIGVAAAAEGSLVSLLDIKDAAEAAPVLTRIAEGATAGQADYSVVDISDPNAVADWFAEAEPPDVVIANAGIVDSAPFLDISVEQWDNHMSTNLTGTFHVLQSAARSMVEAGKSGHVILMGSWVGSVPWPEIAAYSASKAGLEMLARSAARELAPHHVRVNVVAPGIVNAGLARRQLQTEPQYAARVATVVPLGSLQEVEQVADVTLFLCSDYASYMTGSVLLADGGCSLFQFD